VYDRVAEIDHVPLSTPSNVTVDRAPPSNVNVVPTGRPDRYTNCDPRYASRIFFDPKYNAPIRLG